MKIGSKYKICKRLGSDVFEKCQTQKFVLSESRAVKTKGKHRPAPRSDYALQQLEKQRVRFTYGISEKQLARYVQEAMSGKQGSSSERLFEKLESRLDNTVYRLGLAHTRRFARQLVSHGHITVNGKRVTIPSYSVAVGDTVEISHTSRENGAFFELDKRLKNHSHPAWLSFDQIKKKGVVLGRPMPDQSSQVLNLAPVIEFYSR
jgi:small subunit ribosomal protein S4